MGSRLCIIICLVASCTLVARTESFIALDDNPATSGDRMGTGESQLLTLDSLARGQSVPLGGVARAYERLHKLGITDSFWLEVNRVAKVDSTYLFVEQCSVETPFFYRATLIFSAQDSVILVNYHLRAETPASAHLAIQKIACHDHEKILALVDTSLVRMNLPPVLNSQMDISPANFAYIRFRGTVSAGRVLLYMTYPVDLPGFGSLPKMVSRLLAGSPALEEYGKAGVWPANYNHASPTDSMLIRK